MEVAMCLKKHRLWSQDSGLGLDASTVPGTKEEDLGEKKVTWNNSSKTQFPRGKHGQDLGEQKGGVRKDFQRRYT